MLKAGLPMAKMVPQNSRARSIDLYLHALVILTDHGQQADTGDVATRVGVSPAAATRMLKNLAGKKLVRLEPYKGAELTRVGMHQALRVVRRHRLLEVFLHQVMGFNLRETHERALLMQPTIDEVFEEKLDIMLDRPKVDPHGCPIPSKDVKWPRMLDTPLIDLPAGSSGQISRITTEDVEAIKYLKSQGIRAGAPVAVESIAPFDGPISVRVGRRTVHLGRRLAQLVNLEHDSTQAQPTPKKKRTATRKSSTSE
jgi:DtxR family Mn-dependent transcriptional regulator